MRLLLVEDNQRPAETTKEGLVKGSFTVDWFDTFGESEAAINTVFYDAIVLDLGLPDGDGLDILKQLRSKGDSTPVLILTALNGVEDRVRGLDGGTDDYLLKPFAMEELIARIRALLRRLGGAVGFILTAGNVSFDTTAREVLVNGVATTVSRREMGVLEQLMHRNGRVVPKDVLEDNLYGFGEEVTSNSVAAHVSRLRKCLAKAKADISIHTLRGDGYLLSEDE